MVVGYDAETEVLPTYTVGLELPQARIRHIEVIIIPEPYALLGRDILNHFYVKKHNFALAEFAIQPSDAILQIWREQKGCRVAGHGSPACFITLGQSPVPLL
jgi:hypothetical protein